MILKKVQNGLKYHLLYGIGNEVLVADDKERIGYVIIFENGLEFNNMHDDDVEDYEDLTTPVDDWNEYRQSCSQAE